MVMLADDTKLIQIAVGAKADGVYGINTAICIAKKFNLSTAGTTYNITKRIQYYVGAKVDGAYGPLTAALILYWIKEPVAIVKPTDPAIIGIKFDDRTEGIIKSLDPKAVPAIRKFTAEAKAIAKDKYGCEYVLISGNRTYAEQNTLYTQGRTRPGKIVTNAKGGQSNHNFGIAIDAGVFKSGSYLDNSNPRTAELVHRDVAKISAKYGLEWGGDWKSMVDIPHFEVDTGYTMARKRELMSSKGSVL